MKYKVSELDGVRLDRAVAKALTGVDPDAGCGLIPGRGTRAPAYSKDWGLAGPLIEEGKVTLMPGEQEWFSKPAGWVDDSLRGAEPIVALLRAFVASKLGKEIELS